MTLDGSLQVILAVIAGIVLIGFWVNYRLKRVQRDLRNLGEGYYEQERVIMDRFKSGSMTRDEYEREHERLVSEMREESRKLTD